MINPDSKLNAVKLNKNKSDKASALIRFLIALIKNKWALVSLVWLFFIIFVAIFAMFFIETYVLVDRDLFLIPLMLSLIHI